MMFLNKMQFTASVMIIKALLFLSLFSFSQSNNEIGKIKVVYHFADEEHQFLLPSLGLETTFASNNKAVEYIKKIPSQLQIKGYAAVSLDTFVVMQDEISVQLFLGAQYHVATLRVTAPDSLLISSLPPFKKNHSDLRTIASVQNLQQQILNYLENNGYPFARVNLDSIEFHDDEVTAQLKIDKGIFYKIDSIRIFGNNVIDNKVLQHYVNIKNGTPYSKEKLELADKALLQWPFIKRVQPSDVTLLGTGAVLNMYLQSKKSSYFNFLLGVQPSAAYQKKYALTGDVNLCLNNFFLRGESIVLKWQQLQPQSPRLQLGFSQAYILQSDVGADFQFEMFKKDSNFLQWNTNIGIQHLVSLHNKFKAFLTFQNFNLLEGAIDTNVIKAVKKLPPNIDLHSSGIGLSFESSRLNNVLNPLQGNEINILFSVGQKKIRKNETILKLTDPLFNYQTLYDSFQLKTYQIICKLAAAQYFKINNFSTYKLAVKSGIFHSPVISRNELFQIGGNRILRGFDEESIYATQYLVLTNEYRFLISQSSFLSFFVDMATVRKKYQTVDINNNFISGGLGLVFETKVGLLNFTYAMGSRKDIQLKWRDASKIHVGFINYF